MKKFLRQVLLLVILLTYCNESFTQNTIGDSLPRAVYKFYHVLEYDDVLEHNSRYFLRNKGKFIASKKAFDTITANTKYIIGAKNDSISIFRYNHFEKLEFKNVKKVYRIGGGLEILYDNRAKYYNYAIPESDRLPCGNVYSTTYSLKYDIREKCHFIEVKSGDFGLVQKTIIAKLNVPFSIEKISFLDGTNDVHESINTSYKTYPNLVKITQGTKSGIYSYDLKELKPLVKKKEMDKLPTANTQPPSLPSDSIIEKEEITPKGTIPKIHRPHVLPDPPAPPIIVDRIVTKGELTLNEVLPVEYDDILLNRKNSLVYLYKNNLIAFYPNHLNNHFEIFEPQTESFYKIRKGGKNGWIDIRTFKEYYFEK